MRNLHPGNIGHAERSGYEIALSPKGFRHNSDGRDAQAGEGDSVTHGAGGATASMTIGRDDCVGIGGDGGDHFFGGRGRGVAFVGERKRGVFWKRIAQG